MVQLCGRDVPCSDRKASHVWKRAGGIMEWTVLESLFGSQPFVSLQPPAGTQGWAAMSVIHESVRLRIDTSNVKLIPNLS